MELTNPDWLGDQSVPSEFGLRKRTKPGGVTGGVVVGGMDTSLPSAPLLASLRAIQVDFCTFFVSASLSTVSFDCLFFRLSFLSTVFSFD